MQLHLLPIKKGESMLHTDKRITSVKTGTVLYEKKESLILRQAKAENHFLEQLKTGGYTPSNPLVILNPYLISPLTAMILFKTAVKQEVALTVKGKEAAGDISHKFPASTLHILPVYGLYAGEKNQVELTLSGGEREMVTIQTDPLPPQVPVPTCIKGGKAHMGDNFMFFTQTSKAAALACDYRGDVRWYLTINVCFDLKRLANGHLLVGTDRLIKLPYYVSGTYEMGVHGKIYRELRLPGGYHHDAFEMEDGDLLMLSQIPHRDTVEDVLVLVDRKTGEIKKTWDYKELLPYDSATTYSGSGSARDWFHNNAVWYDKGTDSITLSGRHQDAVINLDYQTGGLNWIIGDPEGWPAQYVEKYFFRPVGQDFQWPYEQHGVIICPDGDIMMFDNGHYRSKKKEHYLKAKDSYSRGVRYHLDHEARTIAQVWQYGRERGADFFSPYICNVEYYDEGRYLVHSGGIAYKNGQPLEGLGSMEQSSADLTLNSITCELVDDQVAYELHVPSNTFRAEKLPPYYAGETAQTGLGKTLGSLCQTPEFDTEIPATPAGLPLPASYHAAITEEMDRITFCATFLKGQLAMLLLEEENGSLHRYYINTSASENYEAMCVGTFLKSDSRSVDVYVNKHGLKGKMTVRVLLEDQIFDTGIVIWNDSGEPAK